MHWMYANDTDLKKPASEKLYSLLHDQTFQKIMPVNLLKSINFIARLGNQAAHSAEKIGRDKAVQALKYLHRFTSWMSYCYSDVYEEEEFDEALLDMHPVNVAEMLSVQQPVKNPQTSQRILRNDGILLKTFDEEVIVQPDANVIDEELAELGWVKGDNLLKDYFISGCLEEDRTVDYVLLGQDRDLLALIEAKETKQDLENGKMRAKRLGRYLETELGKRPVLFCTDGEQTYYLGDVSEMQCVLSRLYAPEELQLLVANKSALSPQTDAQSIFLRDLANATEGGNIKAEIPVEYEGPFVVNRPLVIDGNGATFWGKQGPVFRIESPGVIIRNSRVEVTYSSALQSDNSCESYAILTATGCDVQLENVEVRGHVSNLPQAEGLWRVPAHINLGAIPPFSEQVDYTFRMVVPVPCAIYSDSERVLLSSDRLTSGPNEISFSLKHMSNVSRIEETIHVEAGLFKRSITVEGKVDGEVSSCASSRVIWEPNDWDQIVKPPINSLPRDVVLRIIMSLRDDILTSLKPWIPPTVQNSLQVVPDTVELRYRSEALSRQMQSQEEAAKTLQKSITYYRERLQQEESAASSLLSIQPLSSFQPSNRFAFWLRKLLGLNNDDSALPQAPESLQASANIVDTKKRLRECEDNLKNCNTQLLSLGAEKEKLKKVYPLTLLRSLATDGNQSAVFAEYAKSMSEMTLQVEANLEEVLYINLALAQAKLGKWTQAAKTIEDITSQIEVQNAFEELTLIVFLLFCNGLMPDEKYLLVLERQIDLLPKHLRLIMQMATGFPAKVTDIPSDIAEPLASILKAVALILRDQEEQTIHFLHRLPLAQRTWAWHFLAAICWINQSEPEQAVLSLCRAVYASMHDEPQQTDLFDRFIQENNLQNLWRTTSGLRPAKSIEDINLSSTDSNQHILQGNTDLFGVQLRNSIECLKTAGKYKEARNLAYLKTLLYPEGEIPTSTDTGYKTSAG